MATAIAEAFLAEMAFSVTTTIEITTIACSKNGAAKVRGTTPMLTKNVGTEIPVNGGDTMVTDVIGSKLMANI